ncbi:MAG: hypothetical protein WC391_05190 [Methanoregula sp.]|jgi:hypothetical protein
MPTLFPDPVPPFPGWKKRMYHLSRPVTMEDIQAFLGSEELYIRETSAGPVHIIHKYGLLEIHCLPGQAEIEVWFSPEQPAYATEYLDGLLATRFQ